MSWQYARVNPLSLTYVPGSKRFTMMAEALANKVAVRRVKRLVMVDYLTQLCEALELLLQLEETLTGEERDEEDTQSKDLDRRCNSKPEANGTLPELKLLVFSGKMLEFSAFWDRCHGFSVAAPPSNVLFARVEYIDEWRPFQQRIGDLLVMTVNPTGPFRNVVVDFVWLLLIRGESSKHVSKKAYICLFTCMVVRAIHLELVPDLTIDSFLQALRRFVSREPFLATSFQRTELADCPTACGIGTCLMGLHHGTCSLVWRILGASDELRTVLCEVEARINDRPLTFVGSDAQEELALNPAHFLIGRSLAAFSDQSDGGAGTNQHSRWGKKSPSWEDVLGRTVEICTDDESTPRPSQRPAVYRIKIFRQRKVRARASIRQPQRVQEEQPTTTDHAIRVGQTLRAGNRKWPELRFAPFSGEVLDFLPPPLFLAQFAASVHDRSDLDVATKFAFLLSSTVGKARGAIEGIPVTAANYTHAVEIFKNPFSRPEKVARERSMACGRHHSAVRCRRSSTAEHPSFVSEAMMSIIKEKFPPALQREWVLKVLSAFGSEVDLQKFLHFVQLQADTLTVGGGRSREFEGGEHGNYVVVSCLLDTGSEGSFIRKDLTDALGLTRPYENVCCVTGLATQRQNAAYEHWPSLSSAGESGYQPSTPGLASFGRCFATGPVEGTIAGGGRTDQSRSLFQICQGPRLKGKDWRPSSGGNAAQLGSMRTNWSVTDSQALGFAPEEDVSAMDAEALKKFEETLSFDGERYQVRLSCYPRLPDLPDNLNQVRRHLMAVERRLKAMRQYIENGGRERAPEDCPLKWTWYLPHHAVYKGEEGGRKCRTVFDVSAFCRGTSLSSQVDTGPIG
ncbi:hypothetical protein T10_9077 [Trichinella papuae]|uniref:Peptidase A2 domain-containing protein n=1 Tax=Trichinella papuae TaxID=268474 RepID=A0A0V1MHT7_9BILA|nr:hypothetical protein T10_9077 [Trichinella papuae]